MKTLVLNASYEPLGVIHLHRAVVLVLAEKADTVECDGVLRSPSTELPAPSVIRLRQMARVPYRSTSPMSRRGVLARDGHRCAFCGGRATTVDHVHPRSRGGKNTWDNVVAACSPCNARKADRTPTEARMPLLFEPTVPRGTVAFVLAVGKVEASWEPYLAVA